MALVAGTWASAQDVDDLFGVTPSDRVMALAQTIVETAVRRVYRPTDAESSDYYWLRRAVAAQAQFLDANPTLVEMVAFTSTSQDGWSISYPEGAEKRWLCSLTLAFLNNLNKASNATIRFNSAFQGRGRGRRTPRWRRL